MKSIVTTITTQLLLLIYLQQMSRATEASIRRSSRQSRSGTTNKDDVDWWQKTWKSSDESVVVNPSDLAAGQPSSTPFNSFGVDAAKGKGKAKSGVVGQDVEWGSGYGPDDEDAVFASGGLAGRINGADRQPIDGAETNWWQPSQPEHTREQWEPVEEVPLWNQLTTTTVAYNNWQYPLATTTPFKPVIYEPPQTDPPVIVREEKQQPTFTVSEIDVPKSVDMKPTSADVQPAVPPPSNGKDSSIYDSGVISSSLDPFRQPGILAAIIGGAVVGLLAAITLVMFIVYRMRKKDEGSYALDEPKGAPPAYPYAYQAAPTKEFYA